MKKITKTKKIATSDKIKELIFFVRKSEIMLDIINNIQINI